MEESEFSTQAFRETKFLKKKYFDIIKWSIPEREAYLRITVHNFGLAANNVHKIRHKISL
jgi:hypothetical protein